MKWVDGRYLPGWKVVVSGLLCLTTVVQACIWDSDTLEDEKKQHPTLAKAILSPTNEAPDTGGLRARIESLRSHPKEDNPAWWNDLAGAYVRLGQPSEAVKILETVTNRFSADYGIHANLGTAYHLLRRYADAEREIARDLEINPEAHFGLEKYHLALLQYLIRDQGYRLRHVYVDEFTQSFLTEQGMRATPFPSLAETGRGSQDEALRKEGEELTMSLDRDRVMSRDDLYKTGKALKEVALYEQAPPYRSQWDLGNDTNLERGVIYMSTLNEKEPACWVMLGILGAKSSDKNLTIAAYEKAIDLGSPQAPILRAQIQLLRDHIREAGSNKSAMNAVGVVLLLVPVGLIFLLVRFVQRFISLRSAKSGQS